MSASIKKFLNDYGILLVVVLGAVVLLWPSLSRYFGSKMSSGHESMDDKPNSAYANKQAPQQPNTAVVPADSSGQNEVFAAVSGIQSPNPGMPSAYANPSVTNPAELLPNDSNGQWAQLNPSGKGDLSNINLLKAGYHIGIDTIGQSLRNANLQIRSEPPNPQIDVGIWNRSTIEPDLLRVPLEIGVGAQ
jgi:hypothetical protein